MSTKEEHVQKALNRAYFYLRFRPRTKKEVRDYLQKKSDKFYHWSGEIIELALQRLEEYNFINDKDFVDSFVKSRTAIKPKGEYALRQELTKSGVSKDILDEYFHEEPTDEVSLAREALRRRWSRYSRLDRKTAFEKATQFLMRRGFSFSTAKQIVEEFLQ